MVPDCLTMRWNKLKVQSWCSLYRLPQMFVTAFGTSKSRASRSAEVSNYKKCTAIGPQKQVLPIGAAAKPQSFATRFSEFVVSLPHPFSIVTTASQLFSDHLSSSLCSSFQSCSISPLLSSTLFTSSLLFSTLPNDSHLCPPRLHSSQLF